jgi:hypothetical protein
MVIVLALVFASYRYAPLRSADLVSLIGSVAANVLYFIDCGLKVLRLSTLRLAVILLYLFG